MMPVPWKLWEGQVVDLCFPLRRYMGGTDQSAVFLTQFENPEPRNAVIKLVLASALDAELMAQWDRTAQLSHPNLLRLLRRGTCQVNQFSLHYAVTEYAEENLASVLTERPLTVDEVRQMLHPLLDALAYIHGEGLVHGRIKPANIMAVGDQLKLSVDGITTVGELNPMPTNPGPYDPPEFQERGCSPVGDVWSFGITLVEALTRQLPQPGGPKQEPVLPPTLPAEFVPMARACLHVDPRRRAPLDDVLAQFRRKEPDPEPAPVLETPPSAPRKWLTPVLVGAAALVVAAILAVPRMFHEAPPTPSAAPAASVVSAASATPQAATPAPPAVPPPESTPVTPTLASNPQALPDGGGSDHKAALSHKDTAPRVTPPIKTVEVEPQSGQIVHQVMPEISDRARRTIHGTVKINVLASVDASGHVTGTKVQSENSRYFANLTVKAAEQWAFEPQAADWLLRFEFTTTGSAVHAMRK